MDNFLLEHASSCCVTPCVAGCVACCVARYVAHCVARCVGSCACCVQHCVLALPQQQQQQPSSCPSQECTRPPWPNKAPSLMHAGKLCRIQCWTPTSCNDLLESIKCTSGTPRWPCWLVGSSALHYYILQRMGETFSIFFSPDTNFLSFSFWIPIISCDWHKSCFTIISLDCLVSSRLRS